MYKDITSLYNDKMAEFNKIVNELPESAIDKETKNHLKVLSREGCQNDFPRIGRMLGIIRHCHTSESNILVNSKKEYLYDLLMSCESDAISRICLTLSAFQVMASEFAIVQVDTKSLVPFAIRAREAVRDISCTHSSSQKAKAVLETIVEFYEFAQEQRDKGSDAKKLDDMQDLLGNANALLQLIL